MADRVVPTLRQHFPHRTEQGHSLEYRRQRDVDGSEYALLGFTHVHAPGMALWLCAISRHRWGTKV